MNNKQYQPNLPNCQTTLECFRANYGKNFLIFYKHNSLPQGPDNAVHEQSISFKSLSPSVRLKITFLSFSSEIFRPPSRDNKMMESFLHASIKVFQNRYLPNIEDLQASGGCGLGPTDGGVGLYGFKIQ